MNELSIIVPTKDRQAILHRTLENLISASINFSNEILIIDNSTSSDILLPKKLNDSRIKIFKNPGNRNSVFASRNFGASIAKNNLLLFLDDDIIVSEEAIRKIVEFHN
jgi:glycosyltransferase involved in cell wall biosynthesis